MNRSSSVFVPSQAAETFETRAQARAALWMIGLVGLAALAYLWAWLHNPGQALTMGAFDLAEWLSLHAGVRGQNPPLFTSGLLRLHPLLWAGLLAAWWPRRAWGMLLLVMSVLIAAQLPPAEFLALRDDMNYRQQAGLALATLVVGGVIWIVRRPAGATLLLGGIGVVAAGMGVVQARDLMQVFGLPAWWGWGAPLLMGVYAAMIGRVLWIRTHQGA